MQRFLITGTVMSLLLLMLTAAAQPPQPHEPQERCFETTGYCIRGVILTYWTSQGGLDVFGYPISDVLQDTIDGWSGPVQWFERDRLEDHGPDGIKAGRLGARLLEVQHRPWERWPAVESAPPGCVWFEQTSHSLCEPFLGYWRANSGLERVGSPLTEVVEETIGSWKGRVQYFERRRMEHHVELAGTPYEVSLGLLGRELFPLNICRRAYEPLLGTAAAAYERIGCALTGGSPDAQLVLQSFERGTMLWVEDPVRHAFSQTYAIFFDTDRNDLVWQLATARTGTEPVNKRPPQGLYEPGEHFREIWYTNPTIRDTLGWAVAPEQSDHGAWQGFQQATLIYRAGTQQMYIFYADNHAEDIAALP
ncbi:MAG: hypothetical protein HC837_19015 [Chloroflexaceae bacterium]|nr:hypothetical protein [Chloroflexaceae bacterium]